MLIRTAIHFHTHYSFDSNRSPRSIVETAAREGIDCVAITDHDSIEGAIEARELAKQGVGGGRVRVIVGEEIASHDGHIIGLFLTHKIEPGQSAEDTIADIRAQGGVALAPHPFCTLCDNSLGSNIERVAHLLDGVEVHNAQNPLPWQDAAAARFAAQRNMTAYVGCDGHIDGPLAPAYQIMPDFHSPRSFLESLRQAQLVAKRYGPAYFAQMIGRHFWDKVMPWRLPGYGVGLAAKGSRVGVQGSGSCGERALATATVETR